MSIFASYQLQRVQHRVLTRQEADLRNKIEAEVRASAKANGRRRTPIPFVVEGQVQHLFDNSGRCMMRPVEVRVHYKDEAIRVAVRRAIRWMKKGRSPHGAPAHIQLACQVAQQVIASK